MTTNLDKSYQPHAIETKWYETWEKNNYFSPHHHSERFCMVLPPPNVTGSLHMGHGFGGTLMDILVRHQRMQGKATLWQMGTDHAGIATQMVVERQLNQRGIQRTDLTRDAFVEEIWKWKKTSGDRISQQLRQLGASLDWSRECFTLDPEMCVAVRQVFIQLFEEKLIYRGRRLVNWDPSLMTAVSDLEVVHQTEAGTLWHIRYPLTSGKGEVVVATTRPETLLGDVAVAVHPDDVRYQKWIGETVQLPLTNRTIPILADESVDQEFGTGCVKITPAHDFNDYQLGLKHHLSPINIFTPSAHLNENVPVAYQGLERFLARKRIVEDLTQAELLVHTEPHTLNVPRGEKSGVIIEPYLTSQWYLKMESLSQPAMEAVRNKEIRFIPEAWEKTYFGWLENIQDWCISRQLWWGHRIPVWYDSEGTAYAGHDEADVRARYQLRAEIILTQDEDVLDTWFSSALWPFSSLGWPKQNDILTRFFPTDTLVTGFDIIFFWVARMIMMSLKFTGHVPFHTVYITGLIRDSEGQKMSKSKGNVLDPIDLSQGITLDDLIQKRTQGLMLESAANKIKQQTRKEFADGIPAYGTDAVRFTFAAFASYTREIRFDIKRLEGYRNFCNKLWNAARFVFMNTEAHVSDLQSTEADFSVAEHAIYSRLQRTIADAERALADYRFDLLAHTLYEFVWNEYCDWYLESAKQVLNAEQNSVTRAQQRAARQTLIDVLDHVLRLLHPIIPFITEEIWQTLQKIVSTSSAPSIMLAAYPTFDSKKINPIKEEEYELIQQSVIAIRTLRSQMNIAPAKPLDVYVTQPHPSMETQRFFIEKLAKITLFFQEPPSTECAGVLVQQTTLHVPLAGIIDVTAEKNRLITEIKKCEQECARIDAKLTNPQFVERAPEEIVLKEKARWKEYQDSIEKLQSQWQMLGNVS